MKKLLPPALFVLFLILALAADRLYPSARVLGTPYTWVGCLFIVAGIFLLISARLQFRKARTNIYTFEEPGTLQTTGVFAVSRHPMYLGFTIVLLGIAILTGSGLSMALVALFALIVDRWYMAFEERWLRAKFGADYDSYAGRTRRWI